MDLLIAAKYYLYQLVAARLNRATGKRIILSNFAKLSAYLDRAHERYKTAGEPIYVPAMVGTAPVASGLVGLQQI